MIMYNEDDEITWIYCAGCLVPIYSSGFELYPYVSLDFDDYLDIFNIIGIMVIFSLLMFCAMINGL
jgi:hypothetical protein